MELPNELWQLVVNACDPLTRGRFVHVCRMQQANALSPREVILLRAALSMWKAKPYPVQPTLRVNSWLECRTHREEAPLLLF